MERRKKDRGKGRGSEKERKKVGKGGNVVTRIKFLDCVPVHGGTPSAKTNKKRNEEEDESQEIRKERKRELANKRNNAKSDDKHKQRNSNITSAGISVIMTQRWDKRWGIRTWRHRRIRIRKNTE